MPDKFNYTQIQGVKGNANVTGEFIEQVERMAERIRTKPEYLLAAMSFETGGSFSPSIQNPIGATGLIQFLKSTARALGTTTDRLKNMSATAQLEFVEKYFRPFAGRLDSLEAVYTAILSGSPKKPDALLFRAGTPEYRLNPLDWNEDGEITAREAATPVWARLFGGTRHVQTRLLETGLVPEDRRAGFADGKWGGKTSEAVTAFQKSRKIAATGLLDEATGAALFPASEEAAETSALERGAGGDPVKRLQDALVTLGYLEMENVGGGFGKFGPQTEEAVEIFQSHLGLPATGRWTDVEQKIVTDIAAGVAKGHTNSALVKALQNRLVKLEYMTQAQVDTGHGIFGRQTEDALKKFQREHRLPESGVVEAVTYKLLFGSSGRSNATDADGAFTARDGRFYTVAADILMTADLQSKVENVGKSYFDATGDKLIVTSGYRPPERQARAMYNKIIADGEARVRRLYKAKSAIDEILAAFADNRGEPTVAVGAIRRVIENQMRRRPAVFISNHLLSNAVDLRKRTTDLAALRQAAAANGARVVAEADHYHLELG